MQTTISYTNDGLENFSPDNDRYGKINKMPTIPVLNQRQMEKLSDIASDLALVAVASLVLPAVFDKFDSIKIALGTVSIIVFWYISLWLRR